MAGDLVDLSPLLAYKKKMEDRRKRHFIMFDAREKFLDNGERPRSIAPIIDILKKLIFFFKLNLTF